MKRKLQVLITEVNWATIEALIKDANEHFESGSINYSDIINEMILNAKIDIKTLQAKHTNIRKSLRSLASQKEIDVDSAIEILTELKRKSGRKILKPAAVEAQEC